MEYLIAFLTGGVICALVQILMDQTKLQPGRIMVILVCTGAVLSAVGVYGPFKEWAGAGASVPLSGFGHTLFEGVKKAVDEDGFLGIFKGGFTASAVGISAALIFGYLASLVFKDAFPHFTCVFAFLMVYYKAYFHFRKMRFLFLTGSIGEPIKNDVEKRKIV